MSLRTIPTQPLPQQRQFPQALHQPLAVFQGEHYLANLVQSYVNLLKPPPDSGIIVGGDGQELTQAFLQTVLKLLVGNGFAQVVMGCEGLLTPALLSRLILEKQAIGGIYLSSSPADPLRFTLQFYWRDGTRLNPLLLEALQERAHIIRDYTFWDGPQLPLHRPHSQVINETQVILFDAPQAYFTRLDQCFDLEAITDSVSPDAPIALHCLDFQTFAFAQTILEKGLGFPAGTVTLDPPPPVTPDHLEGPLVRCFAGSEQYAIEGINASDSLAIITANVPLSPYYRSQFQGLMRSWLLSAAVDHVCESLNYSCYEGSGHWDMLSQAFDKPEVTWIANETGAWGDRQSQTADGLWAIVFWLSLLAQHQASPSTLLQHHWQQFGRHYWDMQVTKSVPVEEFQRLAAAMGQRQWQGRQWGEFEAAYGQVLPFWQSVYEDSRPLKHRSPLTGIVLGFSDGSRLGMVGETHGADRVDLLVMRERYEWDARHYHWPTATALAPLGDLAAQLLAIA